MNSSPRVYSRVSGVVLSIIIFIAFTFVQCKKNPDDPFANVDCSKINSGYAANIRPILNSASCSTQGCHNANSQYGDITTYNGAKAMVNNGSMYLRVVKEGNMPPLGPLSIENRRKIKCWIDAGAPNN